MIDAPTQSMLQEMVRRESLSLLQYITDAFPWTSPQGRAVLHNLLALIEEERQAAARLCRLLAKHRLQPPYGGAFPTWFTNINFLALDHLLPKLVERQKLMIGDLERDLTCLYDAEARAEVEKVLDMKQRHLKELEEMAASTKHVAVP